ncbi:hypothetical protein [Streptomyces sp. NBC_01268]|uniref:hypothetical protein n=1 Tax=Streptomyces sp. NBC_01268 TaxID=2903806 RepID=UPI002E37C5DC|nr:hypothetical protein [Streptomyces sp. NBC_01268]
MSTVEKKVEAPDPDHLAAVLRHRQAMRARLDAAEGMFEDINREAAKLLTQQYQATRSTKADVTLDDGTRFATVTRVGGEAEARIIDRPAFEAWVRDTFPEHFDFRIIPARTEVVIDEQFAAQVLGAVNAANTPRYADPNTGELHDVPGVAIQPTKSPHFRWLFSRTSKNQPRDGRALVAEAVAAKRLDLDTPPKPPALPPAAEPAPEQL